MASDCAENLKCLWPSQQSSEQPSPENMANLRVLVGEDPPFSYRDGNDTSRGYGIDVLAVLAREVGFRYELEWLEGAQFGRQNDDGSWSGMIGRLQAGGADVALSWFKLTSARQTAMDFADSVPVRTYWNALFVRQTAQLRTESLLGALTKPLGVDVWLSLLVSLLIVSLALWLVLRCAQGETQETRRDYSLGACLLAVYGGFMMQGYVRTPASAAARIVVISHWAMCIIVYATYTAQLASFLTATNKAPMLDSVQQVSTHTQYPLILDKTSSSVTGFRTRGRADYIALYSRVTRNQNLMEFTEVNRAGRDVVPNTAVFFLDYDRLVYFLREHSCFYEPVEPVVYKNNPAYIGLRLGLPQKLAINVALRKMSESGLLQRLWMTHFKSSFACEQPATAPSLGADQLQAILLVVPAGTVAALVWAFLEWIWSKFRPRVQTGIQPIEEGDWYTHIDLNAASVQGRRRKAWRKALSDID